MPNLLTAILMAVWPFASSAVTFLAIGFAIMFLQGFKFPTTYAYTAENFPTKLRALGYGVADGVGHLGGAVGPVVYALLSSSSLELATAIVGLASATSAGLILAFGRRTTGVPLEALEK